MKLHSLALFFKRWICYFIPFSGIVYYKGRYPIVFYLIWLLTWTFHRSLGLILVGGSESIIILFSNNRTFINYTLQRYHRLYPGLRLLDLRSAEVYTVNWFLYPLIGILPYCLWILFGWCDTLLFSSGFNRSRKDFKEYTLYTQLLEKQKTLLSDLISRKGGIGWIDWILRLGRLIFAKAPTKSSVRLARVFARECYSIAKFSGIGHLVIYLKTCFILLQQYSSRNSEHVPSRSISGIGVKTNRSGLPTVLIPRLQRRLIRKGDVKVIKFYLSLFGIYRYLHCNYKPVSYKTITEPGTWVPDAAFYEFVRIFSFHVKKRFNPPNLGVSKPFTIEKVTVAVVAKLGLKGTSVAAMVHALHYWRVLAIRTLSPDKLTLKSALQKLEYQKLLAALHFLCRRFSQDIFDIITGVKPSDTSLIPTFSLVKKGNPSIFTDFDPEEIPLLGRIAKLREAAGKIRLIAIVDPFSQWLLKPLHDWLFSILRNIEQDGTFDQIGPVNKLMGIIRSSKSRFSASLDLSSATDRLSSILQRELLIPFHGVKFANAWHSFLTSRGYYTSLSSMMKDKPLYYAVGQPMGALSSFAMLSFAHHFIWQWAAWRSGYTPTWKWFTGYAVLGDDSSCLIKVVSDEYLRICKEIGIPINLAKSLISSRGCIEFAKRFLMPGGDASPVSLGEILVSKVNFSVMSNWPRKHRIRLADLLSLMGYRHVTSSRVNMRLTKIPRRLRHMLIALRSPWGSYPTSGLVQWLSMTHFGVFKDINTMDFNSIIQHLLADLNISQRKLEGLKFKYLTWYNYNMYQEGSQRYILGNARQLKDLYRTDPQSMILIHNYVHLPIYKETIAQIDEINNEFLSLFKKITRNLNPTSTPYTLDLTSVEGCKRIIRRINKYFDEYIKIKEKSDSINPDFISCFVRETKTIPSPRQVAALWKRYNTPVKGDYLASPTPLLGNSWPKLINPIPQWDIANKLSCFMSILKGEAYK